MEAARTTVRTQLVQLLMAYGIMDKPTALEHFRRLLSSAPALLRRSLTLNQLIDEQNTAMAPLGFAIRIVRAEHNGKVYLAFVNTIADSLAKEIKPEQAWHVEMFKTVLQHLIEEGSLSQAQLASLRVGKVRTADWLSHAQDLAKEGWLAVGTLDRQWYLGPRSLAEFQSTLQERVPSCFRCKRPVVFGTMTPSGGDAAGDAERMVHEHCADPRKAEVWEPEINMTLDALEKRDMEVVEPPATTAQTALLSGEGPRKRARISGEHGVKASSARASAAAVDDEDDPPAGRSSRSAAAAAKKASAPVLIKAERRRSRAVDDEDNE